MKITIYYEDTDCNNICYHTAYMRFCERDRSDIFFKNNLSPMVSKNEFFVVKNINADFIKSVTLGDTIEVKTSLLSMKKASVILEQKIYFENEIIFSLKATIVYLKNNKITPMPQNFVKLFLDI